MKKLLLPVTFFLASGISTLLNSQTSQSSGVQSDTDLVKVYVKQDPATYQKTKPEVAQDLEFAVQLSASSRPITDKSTLKSWEELGPVYIHTENGMNKVRIGPFDSQDKAKQVLLAAKERGKKDAFIVIQHGLEHYSPQGYVKQETYEQETVQDVKVTPNNSAPPVATAPTVATPVLTNVPPVAPGSDEGEIIEYKVRLASFLKPGGFSTKDIDQYGPLESYRQGEWTIMLIGGFKTSKDAARVRDLVIAKGYKDARVVIDRGGILEDEK